MPKEFYTERDIEDLFKRGVMSIMVDDNIVLTELAYEKAGRLGMQLGRNRPDNPPSAPVRPYLSQKNNTSPLALRSGFTEPSAGPATPPEAGTLQQRIRRAVKARLGDAVDPDLLDVIIQRVIKSTGVK